MMQTLKQPFYWIRGIISGLLVFLNLLILPSVVLLLMFSTLILPIKPWRNYCRYLTQAWLPLVWSGVNNAILGLSRVQWDIQGQGQLKRDGWYALICNHQSWADILILERAFANQLPKLKFFMKQSLLWTLPICGLACWVMGYPFVKRYTRKDLRKNPDLKTKSMNDMRRVCEALLDFPTVSVNFLEGTRFSQEKQQQRRSPYQHLLQPNALGLSLVLQALEPKLDGIIDVSIVYPEKNPSFWALLCGQIDTIVVRYQVIEPTPDWYGDYLTDTRFRQRFRQQLNPLWQQKEMLLASYDDTPHDNTQ